jgi:TolB-like protein
MKKKVCLVILIMCGVVAFAQQPTVAVAGFDVQGGVTQEEAGVVYELFIAELVSTGAVTVLDRYNLDKIMTEMKFQTTDWSNSQKTASLGRALNANIIVRGRLMKMDGTIYWTATMLNINTAQVLFSSRQALKDISEVWGKLPAFCKQLVERVKMPPVQGLSTVAVATFDVQGGITPEEAGVITELFITELVSTNEVNVLDRMSFDKIVNEMQFQTSDWSNSQKTAALGRALNAGNVIRGQLMKMGDTIYWTATMLDVNTAQVLHSSRLQLKNLSEVWGKLPEFRQQIVAKLPPPNLFVGRWQSSTKENGNELLCILNIQADGTIIVERYDTIERITNEKPNIALSIITLEDQTQYNKTWGNPNRNGKGIGTYSIVKRDGTDIISTTFTLKLSDIVVQENPTSSETKATIDFRNPNVFGLGKNFDAVYVDWKKNGKHERSWWEGGYRSFTRLN